MSFRVNMNFERQLNKLAAALGVFLLLGGLIAIPSLSEASEGAVSASDKKVFLKTGAQQDASGFSVSGFGEGVNVRLTAAIRNAPSGVTLSVAKPAGLALAPGYTAWTGVREVSFIGTQTALNSALDSLKITTSGGTGSSFDLEVTAVAEFEFTKNPNDGDLSFNADNGHYYQFIRAGGITWSSALTQAAAKTLYDLPGYLVTITSASENNFVTERIPGASNVWIAASDAGHEGSWKWKAGPEAGIEFWNIGKNPKTQTFASWAGVEPNNSGGSEHYAVTNWSGSKGLWNDLPNSAGSISGYVVEFSGESALIPTPVTSSVSHDIISVGASPVDATTLAIDWNLPAGTEAPAADNLDPCENGPADTVCAVNVEVRDAQGDLVGTCDVLPSQEVPASWTSCNVQVPDSTQFFTISISFQVASEITIGHKAVNEANAVIEECFEVSVDDCNWDFIEDVVVTPERTSPWSFFYEDQKIGECLSNVVSECTSIEQSINNLVEDLAEEFDWDEERAQEERDKILAEIYTEAEFTGTIGEESQECIASDPAQCNWTDLIFRAYVEELIGFEASDVDYDPASINSPDAEQEEEQERPRRDRVPVQPEVPVEAAPENIPNTPNTNNNESGPGSTLPVPTPRTEPAPINGLIGSSGASANGVPVRVESSSSSPSTLNVSFGEADLIFNIPAGSGEVKTVNGQPQLQIQRDKVVDLSGSGMLPGSEVQVWLPKVDGGMELVRIPVAADGNFNGSAAFTTAFGQKPLPIGANVVQLTGFDKNGAATVLNMAIYIAQPNPAPELFLGQLSTPKPGLGNFVVSNAGSPDSANLRVVGEEKTALISGAGWSMSLALQGDQSSIEEIDSKALMTLTKGEAARFAGSGFMPDTVATIWLFSEPLKLGEVTINADGSFSGETANLSEQIDAGEHTIQIQGVGSDGYIRSANLGVMVSESSLATAPVATSDWASWWPWLVGAFGLFAAYFLLIAIRRRLDREPNVIEFPQAA
jgi:hypothetical protein